MRHLERKVCSYCGKNRLLSKYGKQTAASDGLQSWCRECVKEYNKLAKRRAYAKEYYQKQKANGNSNGTMLNGQFAKRIEKMLTTQVEKNTAIRKTIAKIVSQELDRIITL